MLGINPDSTLLATMLHLNNQISMQYIQRTSWYFRNDSRLSMDSSYRNLLMPCIILFSMTSLPKKIGKSVSNNEKKEQFDRLQFT